MSVEREMASQVWRNRQERDELKALRRCVEEGIVSPKDLTAEQQKILGYSEQEESFNPSSHCHG